MSDVHALRSLPIFVINLARDAQRRQHMSTLLAAHDLSAEFVPAVDGRTLSEAERAAYDPDRALRVYGVAMLDAEIGCYLSHYRLYERIVRERMEAALILEDDLEISPDLPIILQDLLACAGSEWLVVRLESLRDRVCKPTSAKFLGTRVADLSGGAGLYRLKTHVLGAGAYLIRYEGAMRMLEYGRRIFMPIDHTMDRFWENGILPYVVRPFPVRQRTDFESSIGTRGQGRHRGQPLIVHVQRRIQRIRDGLRKRAFSLSY
jgi:glycosyl transferase, family 25